MRFQPAVPFRALGPQTGRAEGRHSGQERRQRPGLLVLLPALSPTCLGNSFPSSGLVPPSSQKKLAGSKALPVCVSIAQQTTPVWNMPLTTWSQHLLCPPPGAPLARVHVVHSSLHSGLQHPAEPSPPTPPRTTCRCSPDTVLPENNDHYLTSAYFLPGSPTKL